MIIFDPRFVVSALQKTQRNCNSLVITCRRSCNAPSLPGPRFSTVCCSGSLRSRILILPAMLYNGNFLHKLSTRNCLFLLSERDQSVFQLLCVYHDYLVNRNKLTRNYWKRFVVCFHEHIGYHNVSPSLAHLFGYWTRTYM